MNQQLDSERLALLDFVQNQITPALESVESDLIKGEEKKKVILSVQELINNIVRPISLLIDSRAATTRDYSSDAKTIKRDIRRRPLKRRVLQPTPLRLAASPVVSAVSIAIFTWPAMAYFNSSKIILTVGIPFVLIAYAGMVLFRYLTANRLVPAFAVSLSALGLSALWNLFFMTLIGLSAHQSTSDVDSSIAFAISASTFAATLYELFIHNMLVNFEEIELETTALAVAVSEARRRHWYLNKRVSRELHGGLQARLHALTIKLDRDSTNFESDFSAFYSSLNQALNLDNVDSVSRTLEKYIEDSKVLWGDLVDISFDFKVDAMYLIETHSILDECVTEIVRESMNNAIKHGDAKRIELRLYLQDRNTLALDVINTTADGVIQSDKTASLGSKIYDKLATSWSLTQQGKVAIFSATFAIA